MYNESASLSRQSEPCISSNSPIYVRYGGDSAPRTTRAREAEFPRPSTRKYPDRCAARLCTVVRYGSPCLPRGGVVGPVFDGRVGNGVPAVRVAVSGYYEKLELPRRRVYAVRLPRLISGSSTRTGSSRVPGPGVALGAGVLAPRGTAPAPCHLRSPACHPRSAETGTPRRPSPAHTTRPGSG